MVRSVSAAFSTALQAPSNDGVIAVELDFPSGFVRVVDLARDIVIDGFTFSGDGELISVGDIEETTEVRSTGVDLVLAASVAATVAAAFDDDYQGRSARLWLVMIDGAGALVASPVLLQPYRLESAWLDDNSEGGLLHVSIETRLRDLLTPSDRRWSGEDQKETPDVDFSADTGFRYVEAILDERSRTGAV